MDKERMIEAIVALKDIHATEFGGKYEGRFKIAREHILSLLNVPRLYDDEAQQLVNEGFKQGLVIINADAYFHVILASEIVNWRPAPKRVVLDNLKQ